MEKFWMQLYFATGFKWVQDKYWAAERKNHRKDVIRRREEYNKYVGLSE